MQRLLLFQASLYLQARTSMHEPSVLQKHIVTVDHAAAGRALVISHRCLEAEAFLTSNQQNGSTKMDGVWSISPIPLLGNDWNLLRLKSTIHSAAKPCPFGRQCQGCGGAFRQALPRHYS